MRIDLLIRYLNSASSSQGRFHNSVSEYLEERSPELSQSLESDSTVRNTKLSLHKKNETNEFDSQDIEHFKYLTRKIEQNLEITKATIKILEERLNK